MHAPYLELALASLAIIILIQNKMAPKEKISAFYPSYLTFLSFPSITSGAVYPYVP